VCVSSWLYLLHKASFIFGQESTCYDRISQSKFSFTNNQVTTVKLFTNFPFSHYIFMTSNISSVLIDVYDTLTLRNTRLSLNTSSESHKIIYFPHTSTSKTINLTATLNHTHTTLTTDESVPRPLKCYYYVISQYTTPR
jgi:hypothetical protein